MGYVMGDVRKILSALLAIAALLSASTLAWSSSAFACLSDSTANVVGGSASPMPMAAHHAQHQQQQVHRLASRQKPPPTSGPAAPRLDCAACIGVLPSFPTVGPHELMPFMPVAQTFEPLSGISPALDPPPPRAERP